jgi:hypothetical protein
METLFPPVCQSLLLFSYAVSLRIPWVQVFQVASTPHIVLLMQPQWQHFQPLKSAPPSERVYPKLSLFHKFGSTASFVLRENGHGQSSLAIGFPAHLP